VYTLNLMSKQRLIAKVRICYWSHPRVIILPLFIACSDHKPCCGGTGLVYRLGFWLLCATNWRLLYRRAVVLLLSMCWTVPVTLSFYLLRLLYLWSFDVNLCGDQIVNIDSLVEKLILTFVLSVRCIWHELRCAIQ